MFFRRLVCCNTDENVYASSDGSSSGDELGGGRRGATAAVIHWPADHANANFLSQGSIRVLPSTRHRAPARHRKSDSVAFLSSDPRSKVQEPGREEKGAKSLVSFFMIHKRIEVCTRKTPGACVRTCDYIGQASFEIIDHAMYQMYVMLLALKHSTHIRVS